MPGLIMSSPTSEFSRRTGTPFPESADFHSYTSNSQRESPSVVPTMTVSTAPQQSVLSSTGSPHGGASNATMSASSNGRLLRPVERLRLRDWLIRMIETKAIPGLYWLDKEKQIVKIPWKHAARHGWSRDKDACLFRAWAIHTKKYDAMTDSPKANPKIWKANFRCAINSLPDIEELREKGKSKGNDAYKVYRLHPKRSRRHNQHAGVKTSRRQRGTSKARSTKLEKKERKRNLIITASEESVPKGSSHFTVPTAYNSSVTLSDDSAGSRIDADFSLAESRKQECVSLNFHCVLNSDELTSPSVSTALLSRAITSPSSITSPTTPFPVMSPSSSIPYMTSSNALTTTIPHSMRSSPCSTVTSTPATTPQSPPPPYQIAMSQRHGWINVETRVEFNHSRPDFDSYPGDQSDSDCSIMTEAEVAQMVLDIKDQSPSNSPRSLSPFDGNNNMDSIPRDSYYKQLANRKAFFDGTFDVPPHNRLMMDATPVTSVYNLLPERHVKIEPEMYPTAGLVHNCVQSNSYIHGAMYSAEHQQGTEAYDGQSTYLLHQL